MTADASIYRSDRLAAAYAFSRPPVHRHVAARLSQRLPGDHRVDTALDIGCGAGVSTAVLVPLARRLVGVEPCAPMLKYAAAVAPGARFLVGRAEALPFSPSAFDLVTAAGSLNYADIERSLSEAARVMSRHGLFVPYDFSGGRRLRDDAGLEVWYAGFRSRFPSPPGYSLDLQAVGYRTHGLTLVGYERFEVAIMMSSTTYTDYILGDTGVERAIADGQSVSNIRRYCKEGITAIFEGGTREVIFEVEIAYAQKEPRADPSET